MRSGGHGVNINSEVTRERLGWWDGVVSDGWLYIVSISLRDSSRECSSSSSSSTSSSDWRDSSSDVGLVQVIWF